jgi:ACS family D-galactonate transporter-like MFS transporter
MRSAAPSQNVSGGTGSESGPTVVRWRIVALLVFSVALNYVDRGSLSIAAPELNKELYLRPAQMGVLFSAFFWSYAGFMVAAGWLADRYRSPWS